MPTQNKIKTIIFDIGRVLVNFHDVEFFHTFVEDEETYLKFRNATLESGFWDEFDRGILSDEEIMDAFIKKDPSVELQIRKLFESTKGIISQKEYAIPWIKELKEKGYQVLVLSNFPKKVDRKSVV